MRVNYTNFRSIFLIYCIFLSTSVFSQAGWQPLGPNDFNQPYHKGVEGNSLAIDPVTGEIYLAFDANGELPSGIMRKFNASTGFWEDIGAAFSDGHIGNVDMVINPLGVPYVCYSDLTNSNKLTCKKFNSITNNWELVGSSGFSSDIVTDLEMVISPDNVLYVLYHDYTSGVTVKKFNGTIWETVGIENFVTEEAVDYSFAVAPDNTLYVAYTTWYNSEQKATVMKFDGISWQIVGIPGFTESSTIDPKVAVNPIDNMPYVAYEGYIANLGYMAMVKKFNGEIWETVGDVNLMQPHISNNICFAISLTGTLFIGYSGGLTGLSKAVIIKYDGNEWETIGENFSVGTTFSNQIVLDGNTPYMSFRDYNNGTKPTVMKYEAGNWICLGGTMGFTNEATQEINSNNSQTDLIITPDGIPYFGYIESTEGNNINVKKYNFTDGVWEIVGAPGSLGASYTNISMASYQDMPYIAFTSDIWPYKANVMKFNGSEWLQVGQPDFTMDAANYHSLAIAPDGTPYIVYNGGENMYGINIMKYNGSDWVNVGNENLFTYTPYNPDIFVMPDGVPYVAYKSTTDNGAVGVVKKFNGSIWETVGGAFHNENADDPSLAIGPDGYLYLSYTGYSINDRYIYVKRFNGMVWEQIGNNYPVTSVHGTKLAIKPDGQFYVSYNDITNGLKVGVIRYNGNQWVPVGLDDISAGIAHFPDIEITPDGHYAIVTYSSPCAYAKAFDITCYTTTPQVQDQTFCGSATIADLVATGENIKWYTQAQFGTALSQVTTLTNGVYYVSQMQNDCEGPRAAVNVTVNFTVTLPQAETIQTIILSENIPATLQNLVITGSDIQWYNAEGVLLPNDTELANQGIYYATQTINGCESDKIAITVILNTLNSQLPAATMLSYYPNPVSDKLHITTNDTVVNVEIYTLQGQKVGNWVWNAAEGDVDMNYLSDGTYVICLHSTDKSQKFTVIKKR